MEKVLAIKKVVKAIQRRFEIYKGTKEEFSNKNQLSFPVIDQLGLRKAFTGVVDFAWPSNNEFRHQGKRPLF